MPTGDIEYTVRAGDTLTAIAARYDTTTQAVLDKNGLANPNTIYVGQKLVIPVGCHTPETETPGAVRHIVMAGESISSIARRYGVSVRALVDANGLVNPNRIHVGQKLIIPQ